MVRGRKNIDSRANPDWTISGHLDGWAELAVDFVDDSLDAATKAAVQTHLDKCPKCAERLAAQRSVLTVLAEDTLVDASADLESQILDKVLPAAEPSRLTRLFARRGADGRPRTVLSPAGPWLPALAGAAAVVVLVLALTITRQPGVGDEATEAGAAVVAYEDGTAETARDAADGQTGATATELVSSDDSVTGSTQVANLEGSPDDPASLASLQPTGPRIEDEAAMASSLAQANSQAYFFFDTPDRLMVTAQQANTISSRFTSATGLSLMDQSLTSGITAFAAYVPRDDSSALVDLLCSIGDSLELDVCLTLNPGSDVSAWANAMLQDKYALAELSATPLEPPATAGWDYTTSTATPTTEGTATTTETTPVLEESTHVLVVIFMAVQE